MKRTLIAFSAAAVLIAGSCGLYFGLQKSKPRFNVLVVSACSIRRDRLGLYNPAFKSSTPKIDAWARSSFVFNNAAAERPWQNFAFEARDIITRRFLAQIGYYNFWDREKGYMFYVPPTEYDQDDDQWFWSEQAILHYQQSLKELHDAILAKHKEPFFIFSHLKYMHYPYFDPVNMTDVDFAKLSPRSRELLGKYRKHPEEFSPQLPLVELLLNNFDLLKKKFRVHQQVHSVAGVVSDPARDARWSQTPGFEDDLRLARELYALKLTKFDDMASEILNLYGDPELQKNTVVIFTGDHGEAFMEHGVIGHSVNVYEEMLRYPLMVKFPGQRQGVVIAGQTNHRYMAEIVKGIVEGRIRADNFQEAVKGETPEYILSRNCPDTIRSVRYRSQWKFIENVGTGSNELYDLSKDPGEKANLIDANPDMAWRLKEYLVDHLAEIRHDNTQGRWSKVCQAN